MSGIQHRVPRRTVSSHTAPALANASAKTRGCPMGLEVNLDVTRTGPATEMISVVEAAPAQVVATWPTVLRRFLRRLLTVHVRQHLREVSPVSRGVILPGLNPYPPHDRAAFACSLLLYPQPHRLALRLAFPGGRTTGLPRSTKVTERGRSCLSAGGTTSAAGER